MPIRVKASSFPQDEDYLRRYVRLAGAKAVQASGSILILLDCEDDCPGRLGPEVLRKAARARSDVPILVALASREYESWFLAAAKSLRGLRGLPSDLDAPPLPDSIRDAKRRLSERMESRYDPIIHQLEFTRAFDLAEARASPSFDRLVRRIHEQVESSGRTP